MISRYRVKRILMPMLLFAGVPGSPHSLVAQAYTVHGPSDVDLATCKAVRPTEGSTSITFWVIRQPTITGPTQVSFSNLPAGVSVTISPQSLTYPGWVIGQQVTATFSAGVGVAIPDVVLGLRAYDRSNSSDYQLLLHGTCPRQNAAFTIKGSFLSNHLGTIFPVEGALVEIYRDVSWALDSWVGSTTTNPDGSFETNIWTGVEGTYYVKLRLNDGEGVYLHDAWNPSIADYNSILRGSNTQPLIDVGGTVISRDGGGGTPRTAIWQGGRAAFQEFIQTNGKAPPIGDYEIVIQSVGTPWTARSTTNWGDNYQTYKWSGSPTSQTDPSFHRYFTQFETYATNFHEFGHALRHTVDGDQRHFTDDASRWTYGRGHSLCGSDAGYVEVEAFGFNEGWAEYWGRDDRADIGTCSIDLSDLTIEAAVDNDLISLAESLQACLPLIGSPEQITRAQRRSMFAVINRGQNIIHSEGEFRSNFAQQYPSCAVPAIGVALTVAPLSMKASRATAKRSLTDYYGKRLAFQKAESQRLQAEYTAASSQAREVSGCDKLRCRDVIATLVKPHVIRAQLAGSNLIGRTLQRQLEEQRFAGEGSVDMSDAAHSRDVVRQALFKAELQKIVLTALDGAARALDGVPTPRSSAELRAASADLRRTSRRLRLNTPLNDELFAVLKLRPSPEGDRTESARSH